MHEGTMMLLNYKKCLFLFIVGARAISHYLTSGFLTLLKTAVNETIGRIGMIAARNFPCMEKLIFKPIPK